MCIAPGNEVYLLEEKRLSKLQLSQEIAKLKMERWYKAVKPKLVNIEVFLSLYITLVIENY